MTYELDPYDTPTRPDQADGLRRLFGASRTRFVPVVANDAVAFSGLALERLARACAGAGVERKVLVVDAARGTPMELAPLDLAGCIEPMDERLSYLAARGLPMRHIDAGGSCEGFLDALADAAPDTGVVIVHAEATELGRLFARREGHLRRPLLLAADHPGSVTAAYANLKLLAQRYGLKAFDLLLVAAAASPRTPRIAEHFALTADRFLAAALHDWAAIDPTRHAAVPVGLKRVADGLIGGTAARDAVFAPQRAHDTFALQGMR